MTKKNAQKVIARKIQQIIVLSPTTMSLVLITFMKISVADLFQ